MSQYVSILKAASICQVSRRTIYNWLEHGLLTRYTNPGGATRIDKKELIKKGKRDISKQLSQQKETQ